MAKKHNQWMKILEVVFSALAGLFGSLKIKGKDAPEDMESSEESAPLDEE